jgi:hypothetical protein
MLNPFSQGAITAYLERFAEALEEGKHLPRAQYHDSFEYQCNWSTEMADAFTKRHGYDFNDHIQTLFGDDKDEDKVRRMKYDYRLTAAEMHREFIETWAAWANGRGMLTRNQAHGSPANLLDVYAAVDIPETEMFGSPEFPIPGFRHDERFTRPGDSDPRICRIASSAAHVAHRPGNQLVSSESCTWMREHWHGTLGQIKLEMDLFFLAGVNHVFYHGSCYSAQDAPWPGWFFYASTKADWRNSIWRDMPFLNDYIARCQSVLQAGTPANDVLLYWPIHDLWMDSEGLLQGLTVHHKDWIDDQRFGELASLLDRQGFAFDFLSDRMLEGLSYGKGKIQAPGGTYQAVLVPQCTYMPAATMKRLGELAARGATILFEDALPKDVPGHGGLAARRARFAAAKRNADRFTIADDALRALRAAGVHRETLTDHGLRYIRRRADDSVWYFIANHTADDFHGWLDLAAPFTSAILYDPMTGASYALPTRSKGGTRQLYVDMAAGESCIIQAAQAHAKAKPYTALKAVSRPMELEGQWTIAFLEGGPALPNTYTTDSLACWTHAPDEKAKAFAGTASYRLTFDLPHDTDADDYVLDLGDVRESARIRINGHSAGTLFALPMRTRVGKYLKQGMNTLEIEVTNLAANRIRDLDLRRVDWKIMHDANIVTPAYTSFDASTWPLQPSGLLGPVRLIPVTSKPWAAL